MNKVTRKHLHSLIDEIPEECAEELYPIFKNVILDYMAKCMLQGLEDQSDDLNYVGDIIRTGGPEKNHNVVRLPKMKT